MGNTCYINTVCQCLGTCAPFIEFIVTHGNKIEKAMHLESIIWNLCEIYSLMWKEDVDHAIIPKGLLKSIYTKVNKDINIFEQNDISEFLGIFLDKINSEVCHTFDQSFGPYGLTPIEDLRKKLDESWSESHKKDFSSLKDVFYGQLVSQIICGNCKKIHHNYEVYMNIMLPIVGNTLHECLQSYFSQECINVEDALWRCDQCNTRTKSDKALKLWRIPKVLVISLKRFANTSTNLKKRNDQVSIPHILDMSPFAIGQTGKVYSLKAVACHSGSFQFGHYYALAKINNQWFRIDDEIATPLHEDKDTLSSMVSSGYVFFYEVLDPVPPTGPKSS